MKVSITGNAFALTSTLTVKHIMLLQKYNPDALCLTNKDGDVIFSVSYAEGKDAIAKFGVTFGGKGHTAEGFATYTGMIPCGTADVKEYVADLVGAVKANLEKVEAQAAEAARTVETDKAALIDSIVIH